ncbi:MAG: phage tail tape measure protein, partial [Spirochaetaceae bacterium]
MADRTIGRLVYKIVGDDKQFEKSLARSYRSLEKTGKQMQQLGTKLTLGLTVPIAAGSTAMLRAAIDAEETRAKFETAFSGITDSADQVRDNLTENYGLAADEAERLLSSTGDLLKGFGATGEEALGLSGQVQELAVDLASYNNLQGGASRASEILTKAMLGEREALTSLGIKISETDVQQRLLEKGQQDLTGRALLLAKAQATLELAYTQSGDALGDFSRTSDSTANQLRQLQADIRDLSVELGRELLPLARELLTWARDTVAQFSDLDAQTKKNILTFAGLAAGIGPATTAIGTLIRSMGALKNAMMFLGPGGLAVGAIATIAGLTAAFWKASEPIEDAEQKAEMFAESLRQAHNQGMDLEEVMAEIAKRGDVTVQELREIAIQQGIATDEIRDAYEATKDAEEADRERREEVENLLELKRQLVAESESELEAQKRLRDEERARAQALKESRDEAWQETLIEYYKTQQGQLELLKKELQEYQFALQNPDSDLGIRTERGREVVRAIIEDLEEQIRRIEEAGEAT